MLESPTLAPPLWRAPRTAYVIGSPPYMRPASSRSKRSLPRRLLAGRGHVSSCAASSLTRRRRLSTSQIRCCGELVIAPRARREDPEAFNDMPAALAP